ncbi:MAG: phage portal protein [Oscillospiraceae bacterium]|nr:phage portal protein [Oscillospiraceae bacterium]
MGKNLILPDERADYRLYDALREAVPIIDAAVTKTVRLTGGFKVICSDERYQGLVDDFVNSVRVGLSGVSLQSFIDSYLDSLITYGNAAGEIILSDDMNKISCLRNINPSGIEVASDKKYNPVYFIKSGGKKIPVKNPSLILFTALSPKGDNPYGKSVLSGLPYLSRILMRIYESIGQNFDRVGNVRYAVTYKPQSETDISSARERAEQIAKEWSDGMNASRNGEVRDFVAVGDVDIKVIGADNQIIDTEIPVKQILEQIVAKLSIPPFLLGLSWSTTERMSSQQADILTSELCYYRRLLTPVIVKICESYLAILGLDAKTEVLWDNINLQDEKELAEARLKNAEAEEIENKLKGEMNNV